MKTSLVSQHQPRAMSHEMANQVKQYWVTNRIRLGQNITKRTASFVVWNQRSTAKMRPG